MKFPTIDDLEYALKASIGKYSEHQNNIQLWADNLHTEGSASIEQTDNGQQRSTLVPKLIRKHAEWRYASLSEPFHTANSLFTAKPVSHEDTPLADQDSAILAHQFGKEIKTVSLIDDAVRTAVDEGTLIFQVGWDIKTSQRMDMMMGTMVEDVIYSRPTVEVLPHNAIILDPNAKGDIDKAKFAIVKKRVTINELKEVGGFSNLGKLQGEGMSEMSTESIETTFEDNDMNIIEIMEYWGYWGTDSKAIVVTFSEGYVLKESMNPYPDQALPFVLVHYLPVRGENYGEPDGVLLEDSQKIGGAITRGIIDLLGKSANGQTGYATNALDTVQEHRFLTGQHYKYRQGTDPETLMHQHKYPEIPNSAIQMLGMTAQEAESLTGVNTFGQGVSGASFGNGSAAAANGALNSAAKRESGILRRIAEGFELVARKVILMNHAFLEPEYVMSLTNKEYVQPPLGQYTTVNVSVGIRTKEADAESASDLAFLLQTIGNTLDPSFTQMIVSEIAKLKSLPELATKIADFKAPPSEADQINIELMKVKLANETAIGELTQAKMKREIALAAKADAETDMKHLEFVEEESGVNQERDLEKLQAQAQGNMHLKALEAELGAMTPEKKKEAKASGSK